jgi:LacI family transcriptional regulator
MTMATIHDVARRARVSAGTVSNVLNRPGYVAVPTRERVLAAIDDLGFSPVQHARKFPAGHQRTLGLALADLANPFFVDVALGAEAEAKSLGVGVVMIHNGDDAGREQDNIEVLVQQRVHGIMIAPVRAVDSALDRLDARGIPLVYVDRVDEQSGRCWVKSDDEAGGHLAGEYLIGLNHRTVAFVGNLGNSFQAGRRFDGFAAALAAAGVVPERITTDSWRMNDGREAGAALAARAAEDLPTAIMCANDLIALGVLREFARSGIRVPDDVSIVGFDDLSWSEVASVPLTTVRQPREEMGRRAVRMLLDEIDRGVAHVHRNELLLPELVTRDSSSSPRAIPRIA